MVESGSLKCKQDSVETDMARDQDLKMRAKINTFFPWESPADCVLGEGHRDSLEIMQKIQRIPQWRTITRLEMSEAQ